MNHKTTATPMEACRTPAVSLTPPSSLLDPIQRTWDASGHTDRTIFLHAFGIPCGLAANAWDELHYTVQIVLRAYFRRFLKPIKVRTC
ncbi:MAG TPA: hypothetical protein VFQ94_04180 [Gallionella sp.]|nr:hypothetical protein [Gallionella sp.]